MFRKMCENGGPRILPRANSQLFLEPWETKAEKVQGPRGLTEWKLGINEKKETAFRIGAKMGGIRRMLLEYSTPWFSASSALRTTRSQNLRSCPTPTWCSTETCVDCSNGRAGTLAQFLFFFCFSFHTLAHRAAQTWNWME
jgi:hypothetical protein